MIDRLFTEHPRSVGETYSEHLHMAVSFGFSMIVAGFACLIHAIIPALFEKTGSFAVARLHERMVVNRSRADALSEGSEHVSRPGRAE